MAQRSTVIPNSQNRLQKQKLDKLFCLAEKIIDRKYPRRRKMILTEEDASIKKTETKRNKLFQRRRHWFENRNKIFSITSFVFFRGILIGNHI